MEHKKIAVDVVLLLPKKITELCIKINRAALQQGKAKLLLGKKDYIPHISLGIGSVEKKAIPKIKEILQKIAQQFSPLNLELYRLYYHVSKTDGKKVYGLKVRETAVLQRLHKLVMRKLGPFFSYNTTIEMVYRDPGEIIKKLSSTFTKYKEHYSFENYNPHITLLCHEAKCKQLPVRFVSSKLALYHLGNHCTCRKILFSAPIRKKHTSIGKKYTPIRKK